MPRLLLALALLAPGAAPALDLPDRCRVQNSMLSDREKVACVEARRRLEAFCAKPGNAGKPACAKRAG